MEQTRTATPCWKALAVTWEDEGTPWLVFKVEDIGLQHGCQPVHPPERTVNI